MRCRKAFVFVYIAVWILIGRFHLFVFLHSPNICGTFVYRFSITTTDTWASIFMRVQFILSEFSPVSFCVSQPLSPSYFFHTFTHFSISHWDLAGHKGYRGGVSSSSPHGLPSWPPSAHAGLLAERQSRATQIRPDRRHPRQNDPQSQHLKNANGNVYTVRMPIQFYTQPLSIFAQGKRRRLWDRFAFMVFRS